MRPACRFCDRHFRSGNSTGVEGQLRQSNHPSHKVRARRAASHLEACGILQDTPRYGIFGAIDIITALDQLPASDSLPIRLYVSSREFVPSQQQVCSQNGRPHLGHVDDGTVDAGLDSQG